MTNNDKKLLILWSGIIGSYIFGLPSYIFLTDPKIFYFILLSAVIGAVLGSSIISIVLHLIDKSVKSLLYHGLSGLTIGLISGFCWTIITSIFTKWWDGWAFVVGLGICAFSGCIGLCGGMIGRWRIVRIIERKSKVYGDKYSVGIAIGIAILLFIVIPIISRG